MNLHDPVITTSAAWAVFATLLVGIERYHRMREFDRWANCADDLQEKLDTAVFDAQRFMSKHLAAERGLREYARATESALAHHVRVRDDSGAFGVRQAARNGQEAPLSGSVHRPEGWQ